MIRAACMRTAQAHHGLHRSCLVKPGSIDELSSLVLGLTMSLSLNLPRDDGLIWEHVCLRYLLTYPSAPLEEVG